MGKWLDIAAWVALLAGCYVSSFAGLFADMSTFRRRLQRDGRITNGDVAFISVLAICFPVGWLVGLKNLIAYRVNWDAPFGKEPRP